MTNENIPRESPSFQRDQYNIPINQPHMHPGNFGQFPPGQFPQPFFPQSMPDYDATGNMGQQMFNPFMSGMHPHPFYGNMMPPYGMYPTFGHMMNQYSPNNMGPAPSFERRGSVDIPVEHYDEHGNKIN